MTSLIERAIIADGAEIEALPRGEGAHLHDAGHVVRDRELSATRAIARDGAMMWRVCGADGAAPRSFPLDDPFEAFDAYRAARRPTAAADIADVTGIGLNLRPAAG